MSFLIRLLVNAAALWVATQFVTGVTYHGAPLPFIDVWLIHPRQRPMPARVRSLLDFFVARFRDRAWQRSALLAPARVR